MLVTDVQVHRGAIGQFFHGSGNNLLKMRLGLVEFMFLHGAEAGLVALQSLRIARVFRYRFLRGGFLSHV